jgi:hypothetical protein
MWSYRLSAGMLKWALNVRLQLKLIFYGVFGSFVGKYPMVESLFSSLALAIFPISRGWAKIAFFRAAIVSGRHNAA